MSTTSKKLVIFGSGQIAEIAYYYWTHDSDYQVVGFTVDRPYLTKDNLFGLPVVPLDEVKDRFPPQKHNAFVAMSFHRVNKSRTETLERIESLGYTCPSYISSRATTWPDFTCGSNCFIMELNNIQPFTKIGKNVTMWSGNHIGHHSVIGDNCFITSHVVVSGMVRLGDYSFVGVNATIRDNIKIGRANVIGAGCLILHDTDDDKVFRGTETKPLEISSQKLSRL